MIRMLQSWNGYQPDQIVSFSAPEEARLIGLGYASADLDGPAESVEIIKGVVSSAAPSDEDGRPDGTIYIQTA